MVQLSTPSLLVALPSLIDPQFARSIVLLVEQGPQGSVGYIINKPMPAALRDANFQQKFKIPPYIPVWMGGPLAPNHGVVLHNEGGDVSATYAFDKLRISVSEEAIDGLIESMDEELRGEKPRRSQWPYRFILGQSSWGPKQLETELKGGHWVQRALDEKLIFHTPWQEMWPMAFGDLGIDTLDIKTSAQNYLN